MSPTLCLLSQSSRQTRVHRLLYATAPSTARRRRLRSGSRQEDTIWWHRCGRFRWSFPCLPILHSAANVLRCRLWNVKTPSPEVLVTRHWPSPVFLFVVILNVAALAARVKGLEGDGEDWEVYKSSDKFFTIFFILDKLLNFKARRAK